MKDRITILREIQTDAPRHLAEAAGRWLNEKGVEEFDERPGEVTVAYAAGLWRLRMQHVRQAGKELVGAEEMLAKLATLNPEKKLRQYAFHGAEHVGIVFFEKANQNYVGVLIVEKRDPPAPPLPAEMLGVTQSA